MAKTNRHVATVLGPECTVSGERALDSDAVILGGLDRDPKPKEH